jgi:hypothetical protein
MLSVWYRICGPVIPRYCGTRGRAGRWLLGGVPGCIMLGLGATTPFKGSPVASEPTFFNLPRTASSAILWIAELTRNPRAATVKVPY